MKPLLTLNLTLTLALTVFTPSLSDMSSERSALLTLRSSLSGRPILWNTSDRTPCNWSGVTCTLSSVTELRLPGSGLSGQIPAGIFPNLTQLITLSLRSNALSGPLPSDVDSLLQLRNLYLQENLLSDDIPTQILSLTNLVHVSLNGNRFSGQIPNFGNLPRLTSLYLQNNNLSGAIPDLPSIDWFNVSNNRLNGLIPRSLSKVSADAFLGNSLCGAPLNPCSGSGSGSRLSGWAIFGIAVGSIVGMLVAFAVVVLICMKGRVGRVEKTDDFEAGGAEVGPAIVRVKSRGEEHGSNKDLVFFGSGVKLFDLESLLRASAEVLGKGTFGTTYKATMDSGEVVSVKRLKDVLVEEREFVDIMEAAGRMKHENLVPLKAYYYSRDEKLLVFDYMQFGSLSALLHGNKGAGRAPLNWETRSQIALGSARGISYIHSVGSASSHGNIKSSNILLTSSCLPRVSDFGLARVVDSSTTPNRFPNHLAPELTDPRKVNQKADTYSFGVLLLELLTGKSSCGLVSSEGVDLPRWVRSVVREEWNSDVFDIELLRYENVEDEMVRMLQLAVDCTEQYPDSRPSMSEVVERIEEICVRKMQGS